MIKTVHQEIEIEYDEDANLWRFELYGKEKSAVSLANAKKAIDAPAPKDTRKFKPTKALFRDYAGFTVVTVTAEAEPTRFSSVQSFWVKDSKGKRSKEPAKSLFIMGPANAALIAEAKGYADEARALRDKQESCYKQMAPFKGLEEE